MKRVKYILFFLVTGLLCFGQERVIGVRPNDPTLGIVNVYPNGRISMELSNTSKETLKLWEDSNSWGAAVWRVIRIRGGQTDVFFQSPYQAFTVNVPTFVEIKPGSHIDSTLDINGGNWCGSGRCSTYNQRGLGGQEIRFETGDTIVLVLDVPPTKESQSMQVWHGVIAASAKVR